MQFINKYISIMFTQSYWIAQNDQDYILHNTTRYILQNITYNLSGVEIINLNNNNDRFFSIGFFFLGNKFAKDF